jgi:Abnormal spindle-like microcephaly-assoc'd, ASPM-SPD-2-Hydin
MKTPGPFSIRKSFTRCSSSAHSSASINRVPLWIIGTAILIAVTILPASAAPQSNPNYPPDGGAIQPPGWQSGDRARDGSAPDTLFGTLSATPSSVNFGSVALGLTNSQSISLTNTGSANVQISRASITGAGFRLSGLSDSTIISPGASVTCSVYFRPSSATSFSATATIVSNASNSALSISLSGTGTAASSILAANPTSLSFGNVAVGASTTLNLTLTNSGNLSITIYKITASTAAFTTSGIPAGLILAPSQSATMAVTYSPSSVSNASSTVSISYSLSTSPLKISVSGSGVQVSPGSVSLGWQASVSPGVIGYYVYRGSISGGPYTALNSSPNSSTQYMDATVLSGSTYYYVVTSVDSSNMQSSFSAQVKASIPAQ